jgi:hypothetical protein
MDEGRDMSSIKRVGVRVASARGVADRWRAQYQNKDGLWTNTISGNGEQIYDKLCALGHNPSVDAVAKVLGNKSWTHIVCDACGDEVVKAANFGDHGGPLAICEPCLTDGLNALTKATA